MPLEPWRIRPGSINSQSMRPKTFVCGAVVPISRLHSMVRAFDERVHTAQTLRHATACHDRRRGFDMLNKQTFASRHTHTPGSSYVALRESLLSRFACTRAQTAYHPQGKSDYKRMHGPASRLPLPPCHPLQSREQTEVPRLSIKNDPLVGSAAWSIFRNYSPIIFYGAAASSIFIYL